ncbi:alpha-galactosidase [Marchantia polymorpha subsp. ruderalis]|uniref:Alpha-galactosidase n=2 Tax=Marchantia polymorpha TaxID=3197 RepID=A0AAF6BQW7_MARPO|nr:hypothetical protein MARPO_0016s0175 [Marchantia polymorpha]BBN14401.1 hypothetical protein Mp_6g11360 [Marchantia polymorpha subsp. ruderalis]|eukprot:PTQ45134.1 hypothetical protein MARPO_0016s0175 [Marchantia polymorpha]
MNAVLRQESGFRFRARTSLERPATSIRHLQPCNSEPWYLVQYFSSTLIVCTQSLRTDLPDPDVHESSNCITPGSKTMAGKFSRDSEFFLFFTFVFCAALTPNGVAMGQAQKHKPAAGLAASPPRGWNSYDSFSWLVTEQEFLANAEYVAQNLLERGYEYVVVDFLWYRKNETGASVHGGTDIIDQWGRLQPDPTRWPSSKGGLGFSLVAERVHSLGLKFGIHVMRGISLAAVQANTSILGTENARAQNIARLDDSCKWMPESFVGVNTSIYEGRAFIRSLYEQYASWGVDFVKHDCVFGTDLELEEVKTVSEILADLARPVLYSLSPGIGTSTDLAHQVGQYVNAYRVTGDTWDRWNQVRNHFDTARDFASSGLTGASGLRGYSWPDFDMLPLGWLTDPDANQGPHRTCDLSETEQRTLMTLWAIAKSPLFYGGDLRNMNNFTLSLITNSIMLEVNAKSRNNMEVNVQYPSSAARRMKASTTNVDSDDKRVWAACGDSGQVYLAVFNLGRREKTLAIPIDQIIQALRQRDPQSLWKCSGTEAWTNESVEIEHGVLSIEVPSHGSYLYSLSCS